MSTVYENTKSSGHDKSLTMKLLNSIMQKGFRHIKYFKHSDINEEDQDKITDYTIPYATFALCEKILTHADSQLYKKGTLLGPCQHLLASLGEDISAAVTTNVMSKCWKLFSKAMDGIGNAKKPEAQKFIKKTKNVKALITLANFMTELPKSRATETAWMVTLSSFKYEKEDIIQYRDEKIEKWFKENILDDKDYGKIDCEKIIAWNFMVYIAKKDLTSALNSFARLWLADKLIKSKKNACIFDSEYETIELIWVCLECFLKDEIKPYKGFFNWLKDTENYKSMHYFAISALFRACEFHQEEIEEACYNVKDILTEAKKEASDFYTLFFKREWDIHLPWDEEDDEEQRAFKDAILDYNIIPERGREHGFDYGCKLYKESFKDPFQETARKLFIKGYNATSLIEEVRKRFLVEKKEIKLSKKILDSLKKCQVYEAIDEVKKRKKEKIEDEKPAKKKKEAKLDLFAIQKFIVKFFKIDEDIENGK